MRNALATPKPAAVNADQLYPSPATRVTATPTGAVPTEMSVGF
jgi:hypothetical protein